MSESLCGQTVRVVSLRGAYTHAPQDVFAIGLLSTIYTPKAEILLLYTL